MMDQYSIISCIVDQCDFQEHNVLKLLNKDFKLAVESLIKTIWKNSQRLLKQLSTSSFKVRLFGTRRFFCVILGICLHTFADCDKNFVIQISSFYDYSNVLAQFVFPNLSICSNVKGDVVYIPSSISTTKCDRHLLVFQSHIFDFSNLTQIVYAHHVLSNSWKNVFIQHHKLHQITACTPSLIDVDLKDPNTVYSCLTCDNCIDPNTLTCSTTTNELVTFKGTSMIYHNTIISSDNVVYSKIFYNSFLLTRYHSFFTIRNFLNKKTKIEQIETGYISYFNSEIEVGFPYVVFQFYRKPNNPAHYYLIDLQSSQIVDSISVNENFDDNLNLKNATFFRYKNNIILHVFVLKHTKVVTIRFKI